MDAFQCFLIYLLVGTTVGCWDAYWLIKGLRVTDPNGTRNEKMKKVIIYITFIVTVLFWPVLLFIKLLSVAFPPRK